MDKREIAQLVEKSRQGDNDAFAKLYQLTEKQAYFIALRIAKNEDDAFDILQDCYIKAMQKMDTLENPENFIAWFNQIVANSAKNFVTKSKPMLFRDDDDEAAVMDLQVDDSLDAKPDDSLDTEETRAFIRELVDELPEDKRMCVLMFYFQNMGTAEIAKELGISEGTVKTRLYHSRDKIKQSIEALEKKGIRVRGIAPIPFFIWMLRRMAESTTVSKGAAAAILKAATATTATAGTAAGATAATASTVASAATTTTATATAGATATTVAATTAVTTATATGAAVATGVTAKVVAIVVAGAVAVGGGAVGAKVVHDKRAAETTTAITEESTELASENIAVIATEENTGTTIELESSTLTVTTRNGTTVLTVTPGTSTQTTTVQATQQTTARQTTSATTATTKPTTTQQTTAQVTTTVKQTSTEKETTTEKLTTTQAPTTTEPQTARVRVSIQDFYSLQELSTTDLYIESGNTISLSWIESEIAKSHTVADGGIIGVETVAQGGETYTYTAQVQN